MNECRPKVSKAAVLARYQESSLESEEHRKMMSSKQTWENRFDEATGLIDWHPVRTWLDVGCGTARFFEKVIGSKNGGTLERCVGIDAIANNLHVARAKAWPRRPEVVLIQRDIEDLDVLQCGSFDLVTIVGVIYQCGLAPDVTIGKCLSKLAAPGVLLVTTENVRFKGFLADPHGCYPQRDEFERMFSRSIRIPDSLIVQYTNPLWRQGARNLADEASGDYKETFFLASYGASSSS